MPFFPSERTEPCQTFECRYYDPDGGLPAGISTDCPITLLRGGSPGQRGRLLNAACREAANRDLPVILWCRPDRIPPFAARLGDRLLLAEPIPDLPILRREVSLSPLIDLSALEERRPELSATDRQIAGLTDHLRLLWEADGALAGLAESAAKSGLLSAKLDGFCVRLFDRLRIPAGTGEDQRIRVCAPGDPPPPIGPAYGIAPTLRMGLSDRTGIAGAVLEALWAEAGRRGIDRRLYEDGAGKPLGLWLPAAGLYIGGEPHKSAKPINCARFADPTAARQVRLLLRSAAAQRRELGRLMADRREKIADLYQKIDEIFDSGLNPAAFDDFAKDFLISLFCG